MQTVRESHEVRRYLQSDEFCQPPVVTGFDTFGDGNAHRPSASHVDDRPARNCFIDKDGRPVTQGQCQRRKFSTVLTHGLREEKSGARTHNPTVPYLIMYSIQARSCGLVSQTPFVSNPSSVPWSRLLGDQFQTPFFVPAGPRKSTSQTILDNVLEPKSVAIFRPHLKWNGRHKPTKT